MNLALARLVAPLLALSSALLALEPPTKRSVAATPAATSAVAAPAPASLLVASANVREGARVVRPVDNRVGDDRRAFAHRLLLPSRRVPDVMLLQEAMGSARKVAAAVNGHPRAKRSAARYVVAVPPGERPGGPGGCDGRVGRHRVIRDGAILVNSRTARMVDHGFVRTWGRWHAKRGYPTHACAEQAWALVRLRHASPHGSLARVANIHAAPVGHTLKNEAVARTARIVTRLHGSTPRALLVMGGDFNLTRCQGAPRRPEAAGCAIRPAHRQLRDLGFRDAIRSRRLGAVVGVRHRVDFLYVRDRVVSSWWDRCYLAFQVTRPGCAPSDRVFGSRAHLGACQRRADLHGASGRECPSHRYAAYSSDHPIVRAVITWR